MRTAMPYYQPPKTLREPTESEKIQLMALSAIASKNAAALEEALDAGCDPNYRDGQGTLLMKAVKTGQPDSVRALLSRGAAPDVPDSEGYTPLAKASGAFANAPIAKMLLDAGADLHFGRQSGTSPLQCASSFGAGRTMAVLLDRAKELGLPAKCSNLLDAALKGIHPASVAALLERMPASAKIEAKILDALEKHQSERLLPAILANVDPAGKDADGVCFARRASRRMAGHNPQAAAELAAQAQSIEESEALEKAACPGCAARRSVKV